MDAFISRKRRRQSPEATPNANEIITNVIEVEDEDTDVKLAMLCSIHPGLSQDALLEVLMTHEGSVEKAASALNASGNAYASPQKKTHLWTNGPGYQASISSFGVHKAESEQGPVTERPRKSMTRRGKTLHLYSPKDIEMNTPCSIIHNFLPKADADALLNELLEESPTFISSKFQLFERTVESPHTFAFYVNTWDDLERQRTEYVYNGGPVSNIRQTPPEMLKVGDRVQEAVNMEIQRRIRDFYPEGKKLKYQSPEEWKPNTAFVNCYDGGAENVGYHADELTYLGPRAVIGSLSLGVSREFRVRKIIAQEDREQFSKTGGHLQDDPQGQIAIHLPHNSLLVMHAEMQEEYKHSIAKTQSIDPHPLAKNKRINITYRNYKESLHPKYTPRCRCDIPSVLRCATKKRENRGRYMWMCHAHAAPGKAGCSFFQWAEFNDDGEPPWAKDHKRSDPDETIPK